MFAIDFFDFAKVMNLFQKKYFTLKLFAKFMFKCPRKFVPKKSLILIMTTIIAK